MENKQLEKIWTKSFISISLTQLLIFTVFYSFLTTLPIYVTTHLGESQSSAGLAITFMLIAAIIVRPFSGKILEVVGKKKTLVLSIILFAVTTFFYIWIDQLIPLLTLRFIHGISFGILTTATASIAADTIPKSRRGAGMGYFAMSMNLAIVIGPFIGLSLLQFVSFQTLFIILNVLMIIGIYLSLNVQIFEQTSQGNLKLEHLRMNRSDLIEVKAIPVGLISGLVGFAYASILSFVSVHAENLGLSSVASYFFLVFAIVMIAFRPYLGRAFDDKGPKKVLIPSLFIFSIGLILLGFTTTAFMLLLAAGFIGLGYGTLLPGFQTLSIQSTSSDRSGYAISTFYVFYDIGIAAGAYVWGLIVAYYSFGTMYISSGLLVLVTIVIFHMYLMKREKTRLKKQTLAKEAHSHHI